MHLGLLRKSKNRFQTVSFKLKRRRKTSVEYYHQVIGGFRLHFYPLTYTRAKAHAGFSNEALKPHTQVLRYLDRLHSWGLPFRLRQIAWVPGRGVPAVQDFAFWDPEYRAEVENVEGPHLHSLCTHPRAPVCKLIGSNSEKWRELRLETKFRLFTVDQPVGGECLATHQIYFTQAQFVWGNVSSPNSSACSTPVQPEHVAPHC